jgi:hypothetical protein
LRLIKLKSLIFILFLSVMLLSVSLLGVGCKSGIAGTAAAELEATMVPPVDLDVYVYINQQVPTKIPKNLIGTSSDISVQSLAIWGIIASSTQYTVAGALTFTSPADASTVFGLFPAISDIYTRLSNNTIYFLRVSGPSASSFRSAIDNNNFKHFDDSRALEEVSKLPYGGTTNPGIIGVVKPTQQAVDLAKKYVDSNTANTLQTVYSNGKPSEIALGVFSPQPLDLANIAQQSSNGTIPTIDLGVVVAISSAYPGIIFSPVANRAIAGQGYPEVKVGNLTAYKDSTSLGGKAVSIYLNVSGNQVFVAASPSDSYAQTLLTGIRR